MISGVGKTKLYDTSPYATTLVVRLRAAAKDVVLTPDDAVAVGRGAVIVDIHAVVSVWMVINPVTVVVETLSGLEAAVVEVTGVLALNELLEDMAEEELETRLLVDDTLTEGTVVLIVV